MRLAKLLIQKLVHGDKHVIVKDPDNEAQGLTTRPHLWLYDAIELVQDDKAQHECVENLCEQDDKDICE